MIRLTEQSLQQYFDLFLQLLLSTAKDFAPFSGEIPKWLL